MSSFLHLCAHMQLQFIIEQQRSNSHDWLSGFKLVFAHIFLPLWPSVFPLDLCAAEILLHNFQ
jgi:hypothetical protein